MTHTLAVNLTKELLKIESTDPGTYESAIETWIRSWLTQLPDILISEEEVLPGRKNLMAEIPGTTPSSPALIFICHMDTVVVGDGWNVPPFEAAETGDIIYGRGACDMKSGLACCLSAFAHAAYEKERTGRNPLSSLKLICTVDEEDFMRGAEAAIRSGWVTGKDWILDAEPTDGQIQVSHKGRLWYEITVTGRTAHASTPWKGADAIAAMAELIHEIRIPIQAAPIHPDLGPSTVTFGQIQGGYRPYVVPDACTVWIDFRLAPPLDASAIQKIIAGAEKKTEAMMPGISISHKVTGNRPYIVKNPDAPLLKYLKNACRQVTGQSPAVTCFPGYTDTAVIAGNLHNPNCMSYGPGSLENAHQPDEYVSIQDILRCEKVYQRLTDSLFPPH